MRRSAHTGASAALIICTLVARECLVFGAFSTRHYQRFTPLSRRKAAVRPTALFNDASFGDGVSSEAAVDRSLKGDVSDLPDNLAVNGGGELLNGGSCASNNAVVSEHEYEAKDKNGTPKSDDEDGRKNDAPTAPEVNQWTTLMADGTNAAIHRPGKEMTVAEGMQILYKDLMDMSEYDNGEVEKYWDRIMPTVSYLGTENVAKVKEALRVAYRAHRGQNRKSGEPFIIHPVEVALLLSGLKMDAETVMSGLLHDTVEDTDLTFTQVEAMFGPVVRSIVEGETKVSKLPKLAFAEYADEQAENLRQMFVAMTDDYRIIIVKLADRLHNMRTLRHMKPAKQQKISRETLDIFAPLAHRMGIWQFKSELEDTAFMYLYPSEYKKLNRRLRQHQTRFRVTLDKAKEIMRKTLEADPTLRDQANQVEVYGRTKELYSLWHKMEMKNDYNLDHIADVVALRVILDPKIKDDKDINPNNEADRGVWLCYHVLGLVQHLPGFQPMPTRVKDYISFPKPNGYQSLHTALMLNGQTIEVQIRTSAMHQVAEFGMASHWAYTDEKKRIGGNGSNLSNGLYNTPWLSSIKEWQKDTVCSRDFVECVRRELLGKRVFVFLRNGKILNLARGATAIDAAFQIHTEVGLTMHGVEINGKPAPFSYELKNGDVVSILTGEGKPATDWMRYAKSRSTRSKLRSYFRSKQKESLCKAGDILLMDFLDMHRDLITKMSFIEGNVEIPDKSEDLINFLPGRTRYQEVDELLVDIGRRHDRGFLRTMVSKLFKVPLSALVEAEEKRGFSISNTVFEAVSASRKLASDAAAAAVANQDNKPATKKLQSASGRNDTSLVDGGKLANASSDFDMDMAYAVLEDIDNDASEFADPDHLCEECLPVKGDDIVGTRIFDVSSTGEDARDIPTMVHRRGCPHAQRAINLAGVANASENDSKRMEGTGMSGSSNASLKNWDKRRTRMRRRFSTVHAPSFPRDEVPVKLQWSEADPFNEEETYLAEVVIVASDRKLLLADCSEVVSEMAEILKTGSSSSEEHAVLEFLVNVRDVEHLQKLMDKLRGISSVMSVERRFGSELL